MYKNTRYVHVISSQYSIIDLLCKSFCLIVFYLLKFHKSFFESMWSARVSHKFFFFQYSFSYLIVMSIKLTHFKVLCVLFTIHCTVYTQGCYQPYTDQTKSGYVGQQFEQTIFLQTLSNRYHFIMVYNFYSFHEYHGMERFIKHPKHLFRKNWSC